MTHRRLGGASAVRSTQWMQIRGARTRLGADGVAVVVSSPTPSVGRASRPCACLRSVGSSRGSARNRSRSARVALGPRRRPLRTGTSVASSGSAVAPASATTLGERRRRARRGCAARRRGLAGTDSRTGTGSPATRAASGAAHAVTTGTASERRQCGAAGQACLPRVRASVKGRWAQTWKRRVTRCWRSSRSGRWWRSRACGTGRRPRTRPRTRRTGPSSRRP